MPVPKRRKFRAQSRKQRSANMKITPTAHSHCNACGEPKLPHFVCLACGKYDGNVVLKVAEAA